MGFGLRGFSTHNWDKPGESPGTRVKGLGFQVSYPGSPQNPNRGQASRGCGGVWVSGSWSRVWCSGCRLCCLCGCSEWNSENPTTERITGSITTQMFRSVYNFYTGVYATGRGCVLAGFETSPVCRSGPGVVYCKPCSPSSLQLNLSIPNLEFTKNKTM